MKTMEDVATHQLIETLQISEPEGFSLLYKLRRITSHSRSQSHRLPMKEFVVGGGGMHGTLGFQISFFEKFCVVPFCLGLGTKHTAPEGGTRLI